MPTSGRYGIYSCYCCWLGDYLLCIVLDDGTEMKSAANAINGSALIFVEVVVVSGRKLKMKEHRHVFPLLLVGLDVEVCACFDTLHSKKVARRAGFEPARPEANGFQVHPVNHSGTVVTSYKHHFCIYKVIQELISP